MPVIISALLVTVVGGSALLFSLLRRSSPRLSKERQDSLGDKTLSVVETLKTEERQAIKDAFMAGSDFAWVAGGKSSTKEGHRACNDYCIEFTLRFSESYADIVVARDPVNGSFQGAICLVPSYSSSFLYKLHLIRVCAGLGMPPTARLGLSDRLDAFEAATSKGHKDVMGDTPHLYVITLGVAASAQGKGVGRKLMQAAKEVAGERPLYLECHDENVIIYKKMGFKVAKTLELVPKNDPEDIYIYRAMTYGV